MFRFTIRDVLWLMVVVAVGVGWWSDRRYADSRLLNAVNRVGSAWAREVGHPVNYTITTGTGTHSVAMGP